MDLRRVRMAEIITRAYDIDIARTGARPIVKLSQYDVGTTRVRFTVYDGTEKAAIDGLTARVDGRRSDGTEFSIPCDSDGESGLSFAVVAEMTNSAGKHDAEIVIMDGDGNPLGTQNFLIEAERAPMKRDSADRTVYEQYTESVEKRVSAAIADSQQRTSDAVTDSQTKTAAEVADARAKVDASVAASKQAIDQIVSSGGSIHVSATLNSGDDYTLTITD